MDRNIGIAYLIKYRAIRKVLLPLSVQTLRHSSVDEQNVLFVL